MVYTGVYSATYVWRCVCYGGGVQVGQGFVVGELRVDGEESEADGGGDKDVRSD